MDCIIGCLSEMEDLGPEANSSDRLLLFEQCSSNIELLNKPSAKFTLAA